VGPVILVTPFAIWIGIGTLLLPSQWSHWGVSKTLGDGLGWLGIIALYMSIFTPVEAIHKRKGLRYCIVSLGFCGVIAAIAIPFENSDPTAFLARSGFFAIHFLFGALIVGIWNLIRIFKRAPNP
jgi:hypothetical protein